MRNFAKSKILLAVALVAAILAGAHSACAATISQFTAPSGGEVFVAGQTQTIHISKGKLSKNILVELSRDGGASFVSLGMIAGLAKGASEFTLPFTVDGPNTDMALLRASGLAGKSKLLIVSNTFSISSSNLVVDNTNSIGTPQIQAGSIGTDQIQDEAVTPPKIGSLSANAGTVLTADGSGGASFQLVSPSSIDSLSAPSGAVLTANGTGGAAFQVQVPEVVTFLGAYNAATTYLQNDLVTSTSPLAPGGYFFSLKAGNNLGNAPEISPGSWAPVKVEQLKTIRKKNVTLSAPGFTPLFSVSGLTATSQIAGGRVQYTLLANDGGNQIVTEEGVIQWLCTANSITANVQTNDKLHLGTVNSGSTPGFYLPGSQPGVGIFDNVSFSSPAPIVNHEVYFKLSTAAGLSYSNGVAVPVTIRLEP